MNEGIPVPIESRYIFGIDLGTTNSSMAVFLEGRAEIVRVEGEKSMASAVYFGPEKVIVGDRARAYAIIDPEKTVLSIKSKLGTDWTTEYQGKTYTPTDISERILTRLRENVDSDHDLKGVPKRVVICVPANFDANKKEATRLAAEQAGLQVLDLLEEPIAAATAYALDDIRKQTILVYDLGGGTLDVSVLQVDSTNEQEAVLRVLGVSGVPHLGGDNFDKCLMHLIAADFKAKTNIDLFDLVADQEIAPTDLLKAQQKLKMYAEEAKKTLTDLEMTEIDIADLITDGRGQSHNIEMVISREQFEAAIMEDVEKSRVAVDEALAKAGKTIADITRIILVGGSSRVPLITRKLVEWYKKTPYGDSDPATIVARGAAMWGAARFDTGEINNLPIRKVHVFNKVSHFLGVETRSGIDWLLHEGMEIPADAPLTITGEYSTSFDEQEEIEVRILQATIEQKDVNDEGVIRIGQLQIVGLPRRPKGAVTADVVFSINQSNVLTVTATCEGKSVDVSIDRNTL